MALKFALRSFLETEIRNRLLSLEHCYCKNVIKFHIWINLSRALGQQHRVELDHIGMRYIALPCNKQL
jgi:hypothetical protein